MIGQIPSDPIEKERFYHEARAAAALTHAKSDNIIVTPKGQAKITDFWLAKLKGATKLTKTGSTLGTAAYMSIFFSNCT